MALARRVVGGDCCTCGLVGSAYNLAAADVAVCRGLPPGVGGYSPLSARVSGVGEDREAVVNVRLSDAFRVEETKGGSGYQ